MSYDFINPYNFFPLGKEKAVAADGATAKKISGVIEYEILTKTPLFIPDTERVFIEKVKKKDDKGAVVKKDGRDVEEDHQHVVFISRNELSGFSGTLNELREDTGLTSPEHPFIPGSEMRGMVRSVYEMMTDSCLSVLNEDVDVSKRTHEVFKAGLLTKTSDGGYEVHEADDCIFRAKEAGSIEDVPEPQSLSYPNKYYKKTVRNGKIKYEYIDFDTKSYAIDGKGFEDGQVIYMKRQPRKMGKTKAKNLSLTDSKPDLEKAYILKGHDGPDGVKAKKHNCHIFTLKAGGESKKADITALERTLSIYKSNGNEYAEYSKNLNEFKSKPFNEKDPCYFPVYYSVVEMQQEESDLVYLSPASITREVYYHKIKDAVGPFVKNESDKKDDKKARSFAPCSGEEALCPACSLFGTINTSRAHAGRVRFADAQICGSPKYIGAQTMIPLSSPKLGNMEFYLKRPEDYAVYWTYDYYLDNSKTPEDRILWYNDDFPLSINGRKFYWNNDSGNLLTTDNKSDQNRTIYPLNTGSRFKGKVYFDKITESELRRLIYILNCGENTDTKLKDYNHMLKIGAAKPAGLGSIAVKVTSVVTRELSDSGYEVSDFIYTDNELKAEFSNENVKHFETMTKPVSGKVDYPRVSDGGKVFEWFSANHKAYRFYAKNSQNIITDSPNRRTQEFFAWFMEPMQAELQKTAKIPGLDKALYRIGTVAQGDNPQSTAPNNEMARNRASNDSSVRANDNHRGTANGKFCPHCGKFNFRYKKGSSEESYLWKQGICYSCKEKLDK